MIEDIFITMIAENLDALRSGSLPKGKFIGKYMEVLGKMDKANAFRYKCPQVIGHGKDSNNNWLDYIIAMPEEEFVHFKTSLTIN